MVLMKKIILLFISLFLLYSINVFAQSTMMIIGPAAAGSRDTVVFPINVSDFNNIGAISLKITYDTTSLAFIGIANSPASVTFIKNAKLDAVLLGWFDATTISPINIAKGKLVDLLFTGNGKVGNVNFDTTNCEISNDIGKVLPVVFKKGY